MSVGHYIQSERVRESSRSSQQRMAGAEVRGELLVGSAFLACSAALALLAGHESFSPAVAALYVLCIAFVCRVKFDIGAGFTVPTQVVFVPMLFVLPAPLAPPMVVLAMLLSQAPEVLTGRAFASRMILIPANSWFAIGPAVVLTLSGDREPLSAPAILLAAVAAQLVCDFASSAARERLMGSLSMSDVASEMRDSFMIDLALSPLGLLVAYVAVEHAWAVLLVFPLLGILWVFSQERRARLDQLVELNDAYRGTALVLGDVVEADDTYTGEHCRGVVQLALEVSAAMGLDAAAQRNVEFAALLHDVGKIAVPKEIINKPGRLDESEWEIIRTHTVEGQRMLDRVGGFMSEVGVVVRSSHERWDGGGYPDGLRGEQIPLEARIVSCCDAFNAMTTTRSYRSAMSGGSALTELHENSGSQFDPAVVACLAQIVGQPDDLAPGPEPVTAEPAAAAHAARERAHQLV